MSIRYKLLLPLLTCFLLMAGLAGCDKGSTNDQGTSFLALGFFQDGGDVADAGAIVLLNEDIEGSQGVPFFIPTTGEDGRIGGFIGLENRLSSQFIRTQEIDCEFEIPGADPGFFIPADSWFFTSVVEPGGQSFTQVEIVSPDILQYISVNMNALPQLPFRMLVTCDVVGITQAGDMLITNPVLYQVQFAERPECCTGGGGLEESGAGFVGGPGTGGDFESFGDSTASSSSSSSSSSSTGTSGAST